MLASWQLSRPFAAREVSRVLPPSAQSLGDLQWREVSADPQGLVDIARHVRKTGTSTESVFARTTIEASADGVRRLSFGYSDEVTVFLNGAPLFSGDSRFTVRDPEFNGIVGLNDAVYLPLKKGANELVLLVTETFGGWGFMARLEDVRREPVGLAAGVTRAWQAGGLKYPESIAFDPKREVFYTSNYGSGGTPEKRTGTVARLALDGTVREADWVSGFAGPLGLDVHGDTLYVVEAGGVALVDLNANAVNGRVPCPGAVMLNDLDVAPNGDVYASDSQGGAVYRVRGGTCAPWHTGWPLARPNGVLVDGDRLVVGDMADATLYLFRLADAALDAIVELPPGTVDGVERDGRGNWIATLYEGQLVRVTPTGAFEVVADTTAAGIPLADFEFVPDLGLAVVPTFTGNSVIAFRVADAPR
jgi:sugar lactone lactonase YvrE